MSVDLVFRAFFSFFFFSIAIRLAVFLSGIEAAASHPGMFSPPFFLVGGFLSTSTVPVPDRFSQGPPAENR